MENKSKSNLALTIVLSVLGVSVVIVLILLAFVIGQRTARRDSNGTSFIDGDLTGDPDETFFVEDSSFQVNVWYLRDLLKPVGELVISKYYYTDADISDDYEDLNGWRIPLTTTKTAFLYSGVVSLGFDISDVSFEVDSENKVITITLPPIKILANEIDFNTFEYYDIQKSVFNSTTMEETNELNAKLKEHTAERIMKNEALLNQAKSNAESIIENFLKTAGNLDDYTIIFK